MTLETPNEGDQVDQHSSPVSVKDLQEAIKEAITTNDLEKVRSLLQQWQSDASLPAPNSEHLKYLVTKAARHDRPEILGYLLDQGGKITSATALSTADGGSPAVFQVFQDHGWDVNSKDRTWGGTMLSHILSRPDLVGWFLTHGADPNISNRRGLFPLEVAAHHSPLDTVQLLLSHGAKLENSRALNAAAAGSESDRIAVLTCLLDHGADIHALAPDLPRRSEAQRKGRNGTALHSAAKAGNKEIVEFLLTRGADRDAKNEEGLTSAEWAKKFEKMEVTEFLRER